MRWTTGPLKMEKTAGRFDSEPQTTREVGSGEGFGGYVKTSHVSSQEAASDAPSLSARR